ncbi:hypothetical protein LTR50_006389 [Elasticomyces elasticus]|nr:hypothetical protein LTR50_006389 [Elasticomyces elasticus]
MFFLNGLSDLRLDIIGFLAILGEGSVTSNSQVAALSSLFYLPRLLPAPQALLRPSRPATLVPTDAQVSGVHNGMHKGHINHVANVLLGDDLPKHAVRVVEIVKNTDGPKGKNTDGPRVRAKTMGPLAAIALLGCFYSIGLLIASILYDDGMSLLATITLSFLSTLIGISNHWDLKFAKVTKDDVPPGHLVIRFYKGAFIVVKCKEEVARELYFAPEEIEYTMGHPAIYRLTSLMGTLLLMLGVVALANAKLYLQLAWAGAYITLNAAYWAAAAVPHRYHWDLSRYTVHEQGFDTGAENPTFTLALWKTIVATKSIDWVATNEASPQTPAWKEWLREAEEKALGAGTIDKRRFTGPNQGHHVGKVYQVPNWDAQDALQRCLNPNRPDNRA